MNKMYEYLEEHAYISKNKKSNYQFELTRERAECIANKYNSLCEEKDTEIERLNKNIKELEILVEHLYLKVTLNQEQEELLNKIILGSDKSDFRNNMLFIIYSIVVDFCVL